VEAETAQSRVTRKLIHRLAPDEVSRRKLAARLGQPLPDGPLGEDLAIAVWQLAEEWSGDADIGLHFAGAMSLEEMGILGYLGRASVTFGEACARVVRFLQLFKDGGEVQFTLKGSTASLIDAPVKGKPPWPRALAEAVLGLWWIAPRQLDAENCRARRVRFQHAAPKNTTEHERLFGCTPEFAAPANELVFGPEVWELRFPTADPLLAQYLERAALDEMSRLAAADPFLERLERTLVELLPSGAFGADRVARTVGVSGRTLHRRLLERGLTYHRVIDGVRRRIAVPLLESNQHNVTEVAFLVGFSDPSGFRRAFRRWTGHAPRG
jgi:AraC-like DNA-binding protein